MKTLFSVIVILILATANNADTTKKENTKTVKELSLSTIIKKAIALNKKDIYIKSGNYTVGPEAIDIPYDTTIHGNRNSTLVKPATNTGVVFNMKKGSSIKNITIDGTNGKAGSVGDGIIFIGRDEDDVLIEGISFKNCKRACIVTDNADFLTINNCRFTDIVMAVSLQFSRNVRISDNDVVNASLHGIQFWGNWKWERADCSNLIITGNYVKNGGGGAIWGAGANDVVISNNIVDGAEDVGIDLEWCSNSVISGNTVSNFENGGISLFFSCDGVSITGNSIKNNRKIKDPNANWWARSGIWLTYPNKDSFPNDNGHKNVTITGNTISCDDGDRRAIWVGAASDNITIGNNTINRGGIWCGGGISEMKEIKDNTIIYK